VNAVFVWTADDKKICFNSSEICNQNCVGYVIRKTCSVLLSSSNKHKIQFRGGFGTNTRLYFSVMQSYFQMLQ